MDVKKEKQPGTGPKDPRTHERKSRANSRQSCDLIVRAMGKEESENPSNASYQIGKARVAKLVKVVTDQFELRKC